METLKELRDIAKANGVKGYSVLRKADLESLLVKKGLLKTNRKTKLRVSKPTKPITKTTRSERKNVPVRKERSDDTGHSSTYLRAKRDKEKYQIKGRIIVEVYENPKTFSVWIPLNELIREGEDKWGGFRYTLWSTDPKRGLFTLLNYSSLKDAVKGFNAK